MINLPFALPSIRELVIAGAVAALCLPLGYCEGKRGEAARQDAARALANVKSMEQHAKASDIAANERLTDAALNSEHTKELLDAIANTPSTQPDAARVRLGCQRLLNAGASTPSLPAACRS
jgi:hypothetical protein